MTTVISIEAVVTGYQSPSLATRATVQATHQAARVCDDDAFK
jgi:hypothetical protein